MHEVEIEVVCLEILEGGIACLFHVIWMVTIVPQLRRYEDFGPWNTAFLDTSSNTWFCAISCRAQH